ncbi:hypothetical protein [Synechococcus sp. PCC 6312]|uniref:hypothetical protein n=1 Tax=Synechococcus sp. (strain ATCC 27167 / PCC 6312) TaxID=195253 RepID=UPI00029F2A0E|nr:hypothetical protein [Synechococcus sp. PCC 6312]AFY61276.1 hypothetical protein Syn6312_2158 [Synechococcus sp. PCC 6312]
MLDQVFSGVALFSQILTQAQDEARRHHERKIKELSIIADSQLRDHLAAELLMDKMLAPIEKAQHQIQDAAKHAQWVAELISYYYADHGLTEEESRIISQQFRLLAIELVDANSLANLKLVYRATTLFLDQIAQFKHQDRKYSISREVRHGILDRLNSCVGSYENFQRRTSLLTNSDITPPSPQPHLFSSREHNPSLLGSLKSSS